MDVNSFLADAAIDHAINLQQYSNGVVARMLALLKRTEPDLYAALQKALGRLDPERFTVRRLEALLKDVQDIQGAAYDAVNEQLLKEMDTLTTYEGDYQFDLFKKALPVDILANVNLTRLVMDQVYSAAMARPFQGVLMKEWAGRMEEDAMKKIRDQVRIGYVNNEPVAQIMTRVVGTKAANYQDGVQGISVRNLETVTRSAVAHTAAFTRDRFMEANADIVKQVEWHSTLDNRTSELCIVRSNKRYDAVTHAPIGHKIPWGAGPGRLHYNCRSGSIPVLKSWKELGVDANELAPGTRASMNGQVAAETTYGEWLARQTVERQEEVLGVTRARLFRDGELSIDRFANERGLWLSLDQLRARDAAAFEKAGL